ncbi:MAG: hypothetical protein ND866_04980, partial [Pyrinomonadaceae bacterium]|nr:hypothetical protein [Pyrinomonadaceae bacterium]
LHSQASGIPEGHSDYAGLAQNGTAIYVEGKSLAKPKPRPKQERFLDNREKRGAFCCIAFDEVPRQVLSAWVAFQGARPRQLNPGEEQPTRYSWRANYEANLAEAKRVESNRTACRRLVEKTRKENEMKTSRRG